MYVFVFIMNTNMDQKKKKKVNKSTENKKINGYKSF